MHEPRNLWDDYTRLAAQWRDHGHPEPTRYGLTVTTDGTHTLWLGHPQSRVAVLA